MKRNLSFVVAFALFGCGSSGSDTDGGGGDSGSAGSGGAAAASGGGGSGAGSGGSGGSGAGSTVSPGDFRYGVNLGFNNPSFKDPDMASLAALAGARSIRLKLPERHFDKWGYGIELSDMESYASLGMENHVGFLSTPTRAHSTMPSDKEDWQLEHWIPKNLHEPIFQADGSVNPDNYWAAYVEKTVENYHPWVRVWEVWNEPDWVSDWKVTQTWKTSAPKASELPRFNGSIYDYVRMLRISYEVAKKVDPTARIALGGIGYPSFLSAILRYTDNPTDGTPSSDHPETGAAYFDVVSYHYYPIYTAGDSGMAAEGLLSAQVALQKELDAAGAAEKGWVVTESGAPRKSFGGQPGGVAYARAYLMKAMTLAQTTNIEGIDWFALSDGASEAEATGPYSLMGLYQDIGVLSSPSEAQKSTNGVAYTTLVSVLEGASFDAAATNALNLPAQVGGAAFLAPDGGTKVVLWARGDDGVASAQYDLAASGPVTLRRWDSSETNEVEQLTPNFGKVSLQLDSDPVIVSSGD